MAQVFSADARQQSGASVALPAGVPTTVLSTVALAVPFDTAKATVTAMMRVHINAAATAVRLQLIRNPSSDNVEIGSMNWIVTAAQLFTMTVGVMGIDEIDSPRDVVYAVVATVTDDDGASFQCAVQALLISG